jgi:DHA1 family inner membrane transport protein
VLTLTALLLPFIAKELALGESQAALSESLTRFAVVIVPGLGLLADRLGRRKTIVLCVIGACVSAAAMSLVAGFASLVLAESLAIAFAFAASTIISVATAETQNDAERASGLGVVFMLSGLGAGTGMMVLPIASSSPGAWRWLFACAPLLLVFLPLLLRAIGDDRVSAAQVRVAWPQKYRKRLGLLLGAAVPLAALIGPITMFASLFAVGTLGLSALSVSQAFLTSGIASLLSFLAGGRLADRIGRRVVCAIGIACVLSGAAIVYYGHLLMLGLTVFFVGDAFVRLSFIALSTELFPTEMRATARSAFAAAFMMSTAIGAALVSVLREPLGSLGLAVLALCPIAALAFVAVPFFPERKGQALEEQTPATVRT